MNYCSMNNSKEINRQNFKTLNSKNNNQNFRCSCRERAMGHLKSLRLYNYVIYIRPEVSNNDEMMHISDTKLKWETR